MKKILKFLLYFILSIFLLIIVLTVVAKLTEDNITHMVMEKVSEEIKAPVKIDDVSFTLLRHFPRATIELNGIYLGSPEYGADSSIISVDTLVSINKIFLDAKTKPLIDGIIEVTKIEIEGADLAYRVDTAGKTNIDFLMPVDTTQTEEAVEDTTPSAPLDATLGELSLKNITCHYADESMKMAATLKIPDIKIKARAKNDIYQAKVKGGITLSNCSFEGTNLNLMKELAANFNIDYSADTVRIKELGIVTDGAKINLSGGAILKDEIATDITLESAELNLGELIKYAPAEILKEYGVNQVGGVISLNAKVKGIYTDNEMPQVNLNIAFKDGKVVTKDYPALNNINFSGKVTNGLLRNNQSTQIDFKSFGFATGHSNFNFAFKVMNIDHPMYNVSTDMTINVDDFKQFIPDSLLKSIDGVIHAKLATKGQLPDSIGDDFVDYVMENSRANIEFRNFDVNMDDTLIVNSFSAAMAYSPNNFKIDNLTVSVPAYKVHLKNTSLNTRFQGNLEDMSSMYLDIRSIHVETDSCKFNISGTVSNLEKPTFRASTNFNVNFGEIKSMMPDTLFDRLDGSMYLSFSSSGTLDLDSIADQATDLIFNKSLTSVQLKNIYVSMPDDPMTKVENFSGRITVNKDRIAINKMKGKVAGIDFGIDSTEIKNVYETFILGHRDKDLIVQTVIDVGAIDYAAIEAMMPADTTAVDSMTNSQEAESAAPAARSDSNSTVSDTTKSANATAENATENTSDDSASTAILPDFEKLGLPHFLVRGRLSVKQVKYEKNVIDDISMLFRFADSLYVIDQFKLKTCDGDVNTSLKFDARRDWNQPVVDVKNIITGLDLQKLLMLNDNFGDTTLTYDKVSGILTSDLSARATLIGDSVPTDKIRVRGNFMLENGKLYDYKPLVDASVGIGGLKELNKMDFNTLKTSIFMFKNKIYIPRTDVVSSALDLSAFAMQSMGEDEDYEYHIILHLSDVLKGKSDKLMAAQAKQNKKDGGTVDRSGLNLVSMDVGDFKKNGFDNEKLKKKFENNLNKQEGFLKLVFNPLLVNFSTDLDRTARNREILEKYK